MNPALGTDLFLDQPASRAKAEELAGPNGFAARFRLDSDAGGGAKFAPYLFGPATLPSLGRSSNQDSQHDALMGRSPGEVASPPSLVIAFDTKE